MKQGGQGTLYWCETGQTQEPGARAVKLLERFKRPHASSEASVLSTSVRREWTKIQKLQSSRGTGKDYNIVKYYDFKLVKIDNTYCCPILEMEWVDGYDLFDLLEKNSPWELKEVEILLDDISVALAHCHRTQIMHRDISLRNIMKRRSGSYILVDFGMAIEAGEDGSVSMLGTAKYKAPERFRDNNGTFESDIYSLGVVLYEVLTGKYPYDVPEIDGDDKENFYKNCHLQEEPIHYSNFRVDTPVWLGNLIMKCLDKSPCNRFKSGEELADYIKHMKDLEQEFMQEIGKYISDIRDKYETEILTLKSEIERLKIRDQMLGKIENTMLYPKENNP